MLGNCDFDFYMNSPNSGVPEQPLCHETIRGAENRLKYYESMVNSDYNVIICIAIESGLNCKDSEGRIGHLGASDKPEWQDFVACEMSVQSISKNMVTKHSIVGVPGTVVNIPLEYYEYIDLSQQTTFGGNLEKSKGWEKNSWISHVTNDKMTRTMQIEMSVTALLESIG